MSIVVYDERGRTLFTKPVGARPGDGLKGYTATTVSIQSGTSIHTYDDRGRVTFSKPRVSAIFQNDRASRVDRDPVPEAGVAVDTVPGTSPSTDAPQVGIFWCVLDPSGVRHLLTEHYALNAAEEYGDCLTFGSGHYEVWQRWRRTGAPARSLAPLVRGHEYEEWPRGRVVFDRKADRFFLYCDRRIQNGGLVPELMSLFRLPPDRVVVREDPHYRSPLSISNRVKRAAPQ